MQKAKDYTKKKTTLYLERDENKRAIFLDLLDKTPIDKRVYLDESGVNQYLYRTYGRSLRGEQVFGEVSGKRFARESFIAGLSKGKLIAPMCFRGTCDTILFNTWLKEVLIPELEPGQVLILDNASFHRSKETEKLVREAQCHLLFLPPYSPDLNPIEKCWANLKMKIREFLPSVTNLADAIDRAILSM